MVRVSISEAFFSVVLSGAVFVFLLGIRLTVLVSFSDVNIVRMSDRRDQGQITPITPHSDSQPKIPDFKLKGLAVISARGSRSHRSMPMALPGTADLEARFPILPNFTFPQPKAVLPVSLVARSPWVHSLRIHLSQLQHRQINMVTSNFAYTDVLLNWLISATVRSNITLSSILVLSLSRNLHHFLISKYIPSVYLNPDVLLSPDFNFTREFDGVMMVRLSVMRLLNHFGFDVMNYDSDAVILKDPQPLYDALPDDIIGSVGWIPNDLYDEWGVTICIGVVVLRSSLKTEEYWHATSMSYEDCYDDQLKLNYGLKALGIRWTNKDSNYNTTTIHGRARNGLRVSILPLNLICRLLACTLEERSHLYIWHKGGLRTRKQKIDNAREGQTWFLRYHWNTIEMTTNLKGVEWLSSIAYYLTTHS